MATFTSPISDAQRRQRSEAAALKLHYGPDDPEYVAAERDYWADRLHDYVAAALAKAPPLTDEQLERIAALLRSGRAP